MLIPSLSRHPLAAALAGLLLSSRAEPPPAKPWGIAYGAEEWKRHAEFNPLLKDAGVTTIRFFPEWQTVEPEKGKWNLESADALVADAEKNGLELVGTLAYFAPWASADGKGTRVFPVKDMQDWRDFVGTLVERYRGRISYWEVWNEANSSAFNTLGTPRDYADMVREAYKTAKAVDPNVKIGLTCAAFDLHWFDQVIKAGAAGHFDYLCVHPYNNLGQVFGSEMSFLALAENTRRMLAANGQKDIELWISEIGLTTSERPSDLARQAEALVKSFILGYAQGFSRVYWFEAVGPVYGKGVHSILSKDLNPFPAWEALKVMTGALGSETRYLGWLNPGGNTYGFLFSSTQGPTLALWATKGEAMVRFDAEVTVTDMMGTRRTLGKGETLKATTRPVYVAGLPASLVAEAKNSRMARFPWGKDYRGAEFVSVRLGAVNEENGVRQGNNDPRVDGVTIPGDGFRSTDIMNKRYFMYFEVDPSYLGWGDSDIEITMVARRALPGQPASIQLVYESETGYHEHGKPAPFPGMTRELLVESETYRAPEIWYLPPGEAWTEHTWRIQDASFIQKWGWSFQVNVEASSGDVLVKEVRVRKLPRDPDLSQFFKLQSHQ